MGLKLDPQSQAARDLAARTVPPGGQLKLSALLSALYHTSSLKDRFPKIASWLERPREVRKETPEEVPVADSLKPILGRLAAQETEPLDPERWFRALLDSSPGRELAASAGLKQSDVEDILSALAPAPEPPLPAPEPAEPSWRTSPERAKLIEALSTFGRTLTATEPPQKGTVEMERPLQALIRALVKRKQRSAIVIGQPGTGKSAVVYELARLLMAGDESIPEMLREHDVFELSPTFLRSGAAHVGQYDERVSTLIKLLRAHPKVILFVDEVHSLLQSGIHERGPFTDANEAFKQALAAGEISMIGCTTTAEYRHHIAPDQALTERFTIITLEAPSAEATLRILKTRAPSVAKYYDLDVPGEILEQTVKLTEERLLGRAQPRKSIQLLDEACAFAVTRTPRAKRVAEEDLWAALEGTVGHAVTRAERVDRNEILRQLRAKIVGQDEVLAGIASAVVSGLGGWTSKSGAPRGVFFFAGPTGVGKTETALLLSKILGGGRESLVRVDCNTLGRSGVDSGPILNILLGVPPGYLGYVRGKGGVLSRIRDHPESVVLFDEIEKADPGIGKLLLQVMDDGRCEDNDGNTLDFRRSFIIFTTNAGCIYEQKRIGFDGDSGPIQPRTDLEAMKSQIRAMGLGEEFLGRVGHFFVFKGLDAAAIRVVIEAQLGRLRDLAEMRGYELEWQPEILEHLASQWQPRFGVRHLVAILRNRIVEQLSVADAQGELSQVTKIRLESLAAGEAGAGRDLTGLATRERRDGTMVIKVA
jgi:ATP-dependent Clp protease ATP-binding subunit ClpA